MKTTVLFDTPQREIASAIRSNLSACQTASIVTGFVTPSGIGALAVPIRARPTILRTLIVGAATYPGFEALDQLVAWGVPLDRLRVHLGHTRESGTRKHPFVRHHPMLHSKVYYMELSEGQACAFVGSHNVTSFALDGLNGEAGILLEGAMNEKEFEVIRSHIQAAANQAVPYSAAMKEAFAWWTREFFDGIRAEVGIPQDWNTIRTILIFAAATSGERPKTGDHLYFELPVGIAIDSLKTEVHLFLFDHLPSNAWQALEQAAKVPARYTCKVLGAENLQGNLELKAQWQIANALSPTLLRVASGVHRPATAAGMQQVRAEVEVPAVTPYDYLFEREKFAWSPVFSDREELLAENTSEELFPISDTGWQKESAHGWRLVTGLKQREGPAAEKDAPALELAKPESGAFVLVSLRRRRIG